MSTEQLERGLRRLAGPLPEPMDVSAARHGVRRRWRQRRRRRALAVLAGVIVGAAITSLAVQAWRSGDSPTTVVSASQVELDEALIDSLREDDTVAAEALLAAGADPDATGRFGMTALMVAAVRDHPPSVELLLAAGADPGIANDAGQTALQLAATGRPRALAALVAAGPPLDDGAGDLYTRTPLMLAAAQGDTAAVELLLEAGADPSATDRNGRSVLHYGLDGAEPSAVIGLLRAAGAELTRPDGTSHPIDQLTDTELIELLTATDSPNYQP